MIGRLLLLAFFLATYQACTHDKNRCACNQDEPLHEQVKVLIDKTGDIHMSLQDFPENIQKELLYRLNDVEDRIDQIDQVVNQGCFRLAEDIAAGKLAGVDKQLLKKYKGLDWESRNLGFRNWINSIRGAFLLQKADSLKAQILLMKLVDAQTFSSSIEAKDQAYKRLIDKLAKFADQGSWAE